MSSTKRDRADGERNVLDLRGYVPYFLTAISNTWSRSSSRLYLERFGVGVTEWRVISQLAIEPRIAAQRICEVIGLDKGAVSRSVAALVAAGHVTEFADGRDARRQLLQLTASGHALHDRLITLAIAREQIMLEGFTAQERTQLLGFLHRLQARLPALRDGQEKGRLGEAEADEPRMEKPRGGEVSPRSEGRDTDERR
ncbi:MarR family winged helix-turn-helix transcriptional regulator [Bosea sp. AAP35]|uniref:MarR family winged helix-turn-helix transcriptional regulator n=1 Tax=Bosea sp. AAP35 TaxID=1523417 RepID=UPI0006B95B08|nr:MarR family winged helix-turn-helix transcriptional regulator [Bosea sp. AAP35]